MKRRLEILCVVALTALCSQVIQARDLMGISWTDFVKRSELVFRGVLVRAEFVDWEKGAGGPGARIRYTYRVYEVYKGEDKKEVIFTAPMEEGINQMVGGIAIVALRKDGKEWVLSVDERSCWTYHNEMKKDFGGLGVYAPVPTLIRDMPAELRETVQVQVRYGEELKVESKSLFTAAALEKNLKAALAPAK